MENFNRNVLFKNELNNPTKKNKHSTLFGVLLSSLFIFLIVIMMFDIKEMSFFDDFLAIILTCFILFYSFNKKTYVPHVFSLLFVLLCVGLIGYQLTGIRRPLLLLFQDFFLNFKRVVFLLGTNIIINIFFDSVTIMKIKSIMYKFIILLLIFMTVVNSYQSFALNYPKPVFFSNFNGNIGYFGFCSFVYIYSLRKFNKTLGRKTSMIGLILSSYNILLSKSSLSIGLLALFLIVNFGKDFMKKNKILAVLVGVFLIGIFSFLNYSKIQSYFFTNTTPRGALLFYGFQILLKKFPFGVGLSLYGTATSVSNYSPIYYQTGIAYIDGCGPLNATYLLDSYFSAIIGEFGFLGLVLFIALIYFAFKQVFLRKKSDINSLFTFLFFAGSILLFNFANSIQFVALIPLLLLSLRDTNIVNVERLMK